MKILQINNCYKQGSTGKIVFDVHTELQKNGITSVVCYGRNGKIKEENVYKTCSDLYAKFNNLISRFTGLKYGGCFFSTRRLISIIKKERPDIVHLHCINGYFVNIYRLISWLNRHKVPTVLSLHAELMHTANCDHAMDCEKWKTGCGKCHDFHRATKSLFFDRTAASWKKMQKAFDGFDTLYVTSVSPWLMERAKQSPFFATKPHTVVLNGLDTKVFHPTDTTGLRQKLGLTNKKIIFHATPAFNNDPSHIKGGYYVLKLAELMQDENVQFIVAGPYPESINVPKNVLLLGRVTDQNLLAQYYAMADLTLLTSQRETFSMVTAESLCCGTPVVGFCAGAPEGIALSAHSCFVPYGDILALQEAVASFLQRPKDSDNMVKAAQSAYDKQVMANAYLALYRSILHF